jgi:hypothetical protein
MRDRVFRRESSDPTAVGLVAWRQQQLQRAGFEASLAKKLASDRHFDLHAALELIDHGCPPELAARILAPLEDRSDA